MKIGDNSPSSTAPTSLSVQILTLEATGGLITDSPNSVAWLYLSPEEIAKLKVGMCIHILKPRVKNAGRNSVALSTHPSLPVQPKKNSIDFDQQVVDKNIANFNKEPDDIKRLSNVKKDDELTLEIYCTGMITLQNKNGSSYNRFFVRDTTSTKAQLNSFTDLQDLGPGTSGVLQNVTVFNEGNPGLVTLTARKNANFTRSEEVKNKFHVLRVGDISKETVFIGYTSLKKEDFQLKFSVQVLFSKDDQEDIITYNETSLPLADMGIESFLDIEEKLDEMTDKKVVIDFDQKSENDKKWGVRLQII